MATTHGGGRGALCAPCHLSAAFIGGCYLYLDIPPSATTPPPHICTTTASTTAWRGAIYALWMALCLARRLRHTCAGGMGSKVCASCTHSCFAGCVQTWGALARARLSSHTVPTTRSVFTALGTRRAGSKWGARWNWEGGDIHLVLIPLPMVHLAWQLPHAPVSRCSACTLLHFTATPACLPACLPPCHATALPPAAKATLGWHGI